MSLSKSKCLGLFISDSENKFYNLANRRTGRMATRSRIWPNAKKRVPTNGKRSTSRRSCWPSGNPSTATDPPGNGWPRRRWRPAPTGATTSAIPESKDASARVRETRHRPSCAAWTSTAKAAPGTWCRSHKTFFFVADASVLTFHHWQFVIDVSSLILRHWCIVTNTSPLMLCLSLICHCWCMVMICHHWCIVTDMSSLMHH